MDDLTQKHIERLTLVVRAAEIKYGIMGLETLCTPETAAKFQKQWDGVCEAILESRHEDVRIMTDGAIRGIWKMEAEAIAAGNAPEALPPILASGVAGHAQNACSVPRNALKWHSIDKAWFRGGGDEIPF